MHIHTVYSTGDSAVVPEQTVTLVAAVKHARIVGISDHFEYLVNGIIRVITLCDKITVDKMTSALFFRINAIEDAVTSGKR